MEREIPICDILTFGDRFGITISFDHEESDASNVTVVLKDRSLEDSRIHKTIEYSLKL